MTAARKFSLEPDYRRRPDAQGRLLSRQDPIIDIAIVAVPLAALLFNLIIGPLTVVLIIASVAAYGLLRHERAIPLLLSTWPLILLPLFCIASVLWSQAPTATLRYGTLYLVTVLVALIIGGGTPRLSAIKAAQIAFSGYLICSILFGRWTVWLDGSYAFAGLAGSKNAAGDIAGIGLLISTVTLSWAFPKRAMAWAALAGITLPVAGYCLIFAKSTGAILATCLALACLVAWIFSRRLAVNIRVLIFAVCIIGAIVVLITTPLWMDQVFTTVLESSGKDRTLTGRTDLWRVADQYIAANPWLGLGYSAFWVPENPDALKLWRLLGIPIGNPFNFHNTPRSIAVELGILGVLAFAVLWGFCTLRLLWRTMLQPDYASIFFCAILLFVAPRVYFELLGFTNMHMATILLFGAFACSLRARATPKSASGQ